MNKSVHSTVEHKLRITMMLIEKRANGWDFNNPPPEGALDEALADAATITKNPTFLHDYDTQNGAGALWLDRLLHEALNFHVPISGTFDLPKIYNYLK